MEKVEQEKLVRDLKEGLKLAEELLEEVGSCDHSVGICVCQDLLVLDGAKEALQKLDHYSKTVIQLFEELNKEARNA